MKISSAGHSQQGNKHDQNEDRFLIHKVNDQHLFVAVADGLGGHPGGNLAAETVIDVLKKDEYPVDDTATNLMNSLWQAEKRIEELGEQKPNFKGMGTTVVAAHIIGNRLLWAHVGDSRLYHIRSGSLTQLTRDHTFLQDLIEAGDIRPDEATTHPMSHILDQCIGCMTEGPETGELLLKANDTLLLCTDGLYRTINEKKIITLASTEKDPSRMVDKLQKATDKTGKYDDSTVIAVVCL